MTSWKFRPVQARPIRMIVKVVCVNKMNRHTKVTSKAGSLTDTLCVSYFSIHPLSKSALRTAGNPPPLIINTLWSFIALSAIFLSSFHLSLLTQVLYCLRWSVEGVSAFWKNIQIASLMLHWLLSAWWSISGTHWSFLYFEIFIHLTLVESLNINIL